jgi:acetyl esterase/lipase
VRRSSGLLALFGLVVSMVAAASGPARAAGLPRDQCPPTTRASHPNLPYSSFVRRLGGTPVPLLLDEYDPVAHVGTAVPAAMLVHGGGWISGCRRLLDAEAVDLAARGYLVFSVDYRLACPPDAPGYSPDVRALCGWDVTRADPTTGRPSVATADLLAASAWIRANASTFWSWNGKVAAIGESAGGHLVLQAVAEADPGLGERPDVVAVWSAKLEMGRFQVPPKDGWPSADTCDHSRVPHQCWPGEDAYLGAPGCGRPLNPFTTDRCADAPRWPAASPLLRWAARTRADLVPVFFANGGGPNDTVYRRAETVPLREANEFARLLPTIGFAPGDFEECVVDTTRHSIRYLFTNRCEDGLPGDRVFDTTVRFLDAWTIAGSP